ncbi:centrosomal protein of 126 kDa isoform X1 [Malaclemys terrapin pileata]|uniref:centrosomal protein of 126 kDa isoform X1 n=1 Tax=Malaclemys terrapin pileata TaxID=2991368 RepID=UPI0023A8CAC7|nr:centrosomal protein of 126 kDa isoform X1 [Malaclemys terrapin pileata]
MEPGVRAAAGVSPAQREPGSAAPGGPGWRSLLRPEPDSALQRPAGPFAGGACATLKFLLERDLEEEREALLEDQKICRSRARKLCIETNRRRKALEEKQKAEEEKELKSREHILKQRKLKLQEATEKFQRAHLPFSQRRRIVQRKPAPRLEEALEQIQGSVLTSGLYLSSSNRHKSSCRTTDSPSDSSASKNGFLHRKQISTNGGYDKMIQENSGTNLDSDQLLFQQNLEEMQRLLEEQHISSLANFHQEVNQITNYDSPSSLDSLEAGEQNENYTTPSETSLTTQWDDSVPYNSQKSQSTNKSFLDTPELTFSKNQHVNNWLINLDTPNSQPNAPFHDTLAKQNVLIPAENVHNPKQKSFVLSGTEKRTTDICTSDNQITFVNSPCTFLQNRKEEKNNMLKVPSSGMVSRESSLATDSPVFKSSKAWATSDPTPRERVLDSVQEQSSELTQQRRTTSSVQTSNQPMATPVILPPKQWNSASVHNSTFSSNPLQKGKNTNTVPGTDNLDNLSETKDENINKFNGINRGSSLFQDTSNASILCNTDQEEDKKEEKGNVDEAMSPLSNTKFNCDLSEHHRYLRNNMHERKGVKLPKSILKKESKYENYCFKAVVLNRRISFGNQTASSIRDSLELAKIKGKDAENQKTNKKLRWFDEIDKIVVEDDEKCSEKTTTGVSQAQLQPSYVQSKLNASNNNLRSIPACTTNSICTENHQDYPPIFTKIVAAGGSERDYMPLRSFVSTGYHFAKQAWMASKGDESKPPAYSGDSKIQKGNLRKGKTKIIRRPRSAKTQSGFTPKNRKGTIIRPQSASEVHKIIKAQGKIIVPHPPPKPVPGNRTDQNVADTMCQPVNSSKCQSNTTNGNYVNARHLLPADQVLNRTTIENNKSITCSSDLVTVTLAPPPSYNVSPSEPLEKTNYTLNNIQTIAQQDSLITGTKRKPVCAENGLRLDRTPTDEEINLLWQGVHSALAQKDYAAGDFRHYDACYNNSFSTNLQSTKANISHVTIDGGNLLTSFKSSRMNGFFSSSSNGAVPVTRRKQISDNSENKRRALLEQRRQIVASAGRRSTYDALNKVHTVQLSPFQCAFEPVQTVSGIPNSDEVSESTAQFLLAENLAGTSVTEGEILAAMETVQPPGQTMLLNKAQRRGMSALSLEEQKILQSLDRLNQRLQNVQETIAKNLSTSSVLQIISPLSLQFDSGSIEVRGRVRSASIPMDVSERGGHSVPQRKGSALCRLKSQFKI